jgi:hypothetical protein
MQCNATTAMVSAIKNLPIAPGGLYVAIFVVKVGILIGIGMIKILIV